MDPADERAAYREALARAEASATEFDEAGREIPATPELPGAVPVQASDQPLTVEPVVETDTPTEQVVTPEQEPTVEPVVEKTPEQLAADIAVLEARLAEKDSFIGLQSSEVGELRTAVDEMRQQLAAQAQPVTPQAPTVQITQDFIDSNPAAAAQAAFDQQNEAALRVAFEAWKDEDPFAAAAWRNDRLIEAQQARFEAELAKRDAEIAQVKEPLAQQTAQTAEQAAWKSAFDEVQKTVPDFLAVDETGRSNAVRLLEEVAPKYPAIAKMIADGDVEAKVQGLTLLYEASKLGNPETVRAELETAAAAAAAEAAAASQGASVVTSQTTAGQAPVGEKTDEQLEQERYIQRIEGKASLRTGWTGRS